MSVRAYRVVKKELADSSFNLWHDTDLVDFLERDHDFFEGRNSDGIGAFEVPVERLKELLADFPQRAGEGRDYQRKAIAADVAWAEANGHDLVQYECF